MLDTSDIRFFYFFVAPFCFRFAQGIFLLLIKSSLHILWQQIFWNIKTWHYAHISSRLVHHMDFLLFFTGHFLLRAYTGPASFRTHFIWWSNILLHRREGEGGRVSNPLLLHPLQKWDNTSNPSIVQSMLVPLGVIHYLFWPNNRPI